MKNMFIDKNEHIVFSVFDTDNLEEIRLLLEKTQRKLYYRELDIENDIIVKGGGAHFPKAVFFKSKTANMIVQYSNYQDGWATLSNSISYELNKPFYKFEFSNPAAPDKKYSLERRENGKISRVIYAMQDPKWIFYEQGNRLSFEDINNYEKKRIPERLNKKIIIEYCLRLGLDITDDDFWKSSELALFYEYTSWK
jgi:hypothetical protein